MKLLNSNIVIYNTYNDYFIELISDLVIDVIVFQKLRLRVLCESLSV